MKVLVLGPNGSGKSAYAERVARNFSSGELYYIATMVPYGEEGAERVEKHIKQRESMGFITVEKPFNIAEIQLSHNATILLEDVSNLLGNAMFGGERNGSEASVFADITGLCVKCNTAVLVSINGLVAGPEYDEETNGYISSLNLLNNLLFDFADIAVAMSDGTPVFIKGESHALD